MERRNENFILKPERKHISKDSSSCKISKGVLDEVGKYVSRVLWYLIYS